MIETQTGGDRFPVETAGPSDLVARLTAATAEAIANERPSLEHEPARIRSVVLELYLDARGRIDEGRCFVERRLKAGRR